MRFLGQPLFAAIILEPVHLMHPHMQERHDADVATRHPDSATSCSSSSRAKVFDLWSGATYDAAVNLLWGLT
jgi:hypothetical protein